MKISFAVTAFHEESRNYYKWINECIAPALEHPNVGEVVIIDDTAHAESYDCLAGELPEHDKIHLFHLPVNHGVFGAKLESVICSQFDWVLMADSDNVFDKKTFNLITDVEPPDVLFCPTFGKPALDYRHMAGTYSLKDFPKLKCLPASDCMMNTGNQLVNRRRFVEVLGKYRGPRFDLKQPWHYTGDRTALKWRVVYDSADSYFINKEWLLSGGRLCIVPGFEYTHGSLTPEHQAVAKSSWDNAPAEKERLPRIYEKELLEAACRL